MQSRGVYHRAHPRRQARHSEGHAGTLHGPRATYAPLRLSSRAAATHTGRARTEEADRWPQATARSESVSLSYTTGPRPFLRTLRHSQARHALLRLALRRMPSRLARCAAAWSCVVVSTRMQCAASQHNMLATATHRSSAWRSDAPQPLSPPRPLPSVRYRSRSRRAAFRRIACPGTAAAAVALRSLPCHSRDRERTAYSIHRAARRQARRWCRRRAPNADPLNAVACSTSH
jgi:hypothetical protein